MEMKRFHLRLPKELQDQLAKLAQDDRRSLNQKIILILEDYVKKQEGKQGKGEKKK
jgi:hypothetical protein